MERFSCKLHKILRATLPRITFSYDPRDIPEANAFDCLAMQTQADTLIIATDSLNRAWQDLDVDPCLSRAVFTKACAIDHTDL